VKAVSIEKYLLPDPMITSASQYRASAVEVLALLCAWLRSPKDLMSLSTKYARCAATLSEIINDTAAHIWDHWKHLLDWDFLGIVSPEWLQTYADAIADYGLPCHSVIRFIDCTIHKTC